MADFTGYTIDDVLFIHTTVLKMSHEEPMDGVLSQGNLELAVEAPLLEVFGRKIYPDTISKIGALMYEITTLHPFVEGNKRTGYMCADTLMILNDHFITASAEETVKASLAVAKLEMSRDELIAWLKENAVEKAFLERNIPHAAQRLSKLKGTVSRFINQR